MKQLRDRLVLGLNGFLNRFRSQHAPAENILVLVPHCLQRSSCGHNVIHDVDQCERCGECAVGGLLELREAFGVKLSLVSGGRQAVAAVKSPEVHLIVAVACERELAQGVMAAFPKTVIPVPNTQPEGPCKNTQVSLDALRAVLEAVVEHSPS